MRKIRKGNSIILLLTLVLTIILMSIINSTYKVNRTVQSHKIANEDVINKEAIIVKSDGVKVATLQSEEDISALLEIIKEESIKNSNMTKANEVILNNKITYYTDIVSEDEIREPKYFAYNIINGHDDVWSISFTVKGEKAKDSNPVLSRGTISSTFGMRWGRMHKGIDIAAPKGTPIHAILPGKVIFSGWESGYGYVVKIEDEEDRITIYGHCSKLFVKKGEIIKEGDKIAEVGSTGNSTGPHLHFEVRIKGEPVDPSDYIK